jgi:Ca2+-binding RTX toxin-like protein
MREAVLAHALREPVVTTVKFHNATIKGFEMPSSAKDGYVITNDTETAGTLGSVSQDDGSIIVFDVLDQPGLTDLRITYSAVGETVTIEQLQYYFNSLLVMEFQEMNLVGSKSDLGSGKILSTSITSSNDHITGSGFADKLFGGPGGDQVFANAGNDYVSGDSGNDTLYGMTGNDKLFGGPGADVLDSGPGKDIVYGGAAPDVFLFDQLDDRVTIKDFSLNADTIRIDKSLARKFKKLKAIADEYKDGVKLDFHGDDLLIIENVALNRLKKIDFDFVHL